MHVSLDYLFIFFAFGRHIWRQGGFNVLKTCISTSQSTLCVCRSSRWAVRGSSMSVGQQRWLWGSPVPWCRTTFPDSAPCHFTRERASPFLPQQKVECVHIRHLKALTSVWINKNRTSTSVFLCNGVTLYIPSKLSHVHLFTLHTLLAAHNLSFSLCFKVSGLSPIPWTYKGKQYTQ